ncbi:RNA-binding domain-containing protein [Piromyces finnis]|uniref:RNA-binding domain-containing protein n=1 Tax=Piromyces finnis TaxID=1754191 RepID=A0A1Y1VG52_9FUNG|nr:RNA-binding domain-containing protein [Piromyces finnis]|eukprot:ORX55395.1 RNA-binding domain-containing protein [Piromyces finnis]
MTSKLDMSLDEQIYKSKRENRSSFRRSRNSRYSSKGINDQWKHDKYDDNFGSSERKQIFSRIGNRSNNNYAISVTNLHWEVSEKDLKKIFEEVGEVSKVRIKYDKAGRSEGEATIVFNSRSDALKAIDKFDGVDLDGMDMKIKMDDSYSRKNNNNNGNDSRRNRSSVFNRLGQGKGFKNRQIKKSTNRTSKRRDNREHLTKEMLDEEMDRYMSNEMDVEIAENNEENKEATSTVRNVVSYDDEDEPVKGDINA